MSVQSAPIILKFAQVSEQMTAGTKRIVGHVKVRNLAGVISAVDLEANPRSSKTGQITDAILESLEKTPETFPSKTKGILMGCSQYRALERRRYELDFIEPGVEGILDGGHNALAIGVHILNVAGVTEPNPARIGYWSDFKELWELHEEEVAAVTGDATRTELDVLVPVELLVPLDPDDDPTVADFSTSLLDICAARNNNAQLKAETKVNQSGYFETLKELLPSNIADAVEWKQNSKGRIKAGDVVALSWIPLMLLTLPNDEDGRPVEAPAAQKIYSGKGDCIQRFERLMSSTEITTREDGQYRRTLKSEQVRSAFEVTAKLVELYDIIYAKLPEAYNAAGGIFGRINAVSKLNATKSAKFTKFTNRKVGTAIPEGFVVPLVYALQALMEIDSEGRVGWRTDPDAFMQKHFDQVVVDYKSAIALLDYDPQKVGKSPDAYRIAKSAFEMQLLRSGA